MTADPAKGDGLSGIYADGSYLEKNATWHAEDSPWKARQILNMLNSNQLTPQTVGEVGCGAGEILHQLSLSMPDTAFCGFELSPQAYELCKTRESEMLSFRCNDILEQDVFFELLLCIDVFEHVEDYLGFLRGIRSKGRFKIFHIPLDVTVASVANATMTRTRDAVGHLHYFTRESALATLVDCGYEIVDEAYTLIFDHLKKPGLRGRLSQSVQRNLYKIAPHWAVRLVGGCSLLVLTK